MADLTVQEIDIDNPLTPVFVLAGALGDDFINDGKTMIILRNTGAGSMVVTVESQEDCDEGNNHDITFNGILGDDSMCGYFPRGRFNNPNTDKVSIGYSATGPNIFVAVVRFVTKD